MNIYKSKRDIFVAHQIAIKFRLRYDVPESSYEKFFDALRVHHNWTLSEFSREVEHLNSRYPISVGLNVEVPVKCPDGSTVGLKSVMLEHESGPEFFLQIDPQTALLMVGGWLGAKLVSKIDEKLTTTVIDCLVGAVRSRWPEFATKFGSPFKFIELRTEHKGVMRILPEDFAPAQLTCLIKNFDRISHIEESNQGCFGGKLFIPDDSRHD